MPPKNLAKNLAENLARSLAKNLVSRILVIDDEPSVTDALRLVLSELGHHVDAAKSGAEAKEFLKGSPYDLVFTDLRLPDSSGIDLLALIKSDTPNTEVILMTACLDSEIAGAYSFFAYSL